MSNFFQHGGIGILGLLVAAIAFAVPVYGGRRRSPQQPRSPGERFQADQWTREAAARYRDAGL